MKRSAVFLKYFGTIAWVIGIGAYLLGVLFKILHWEGASLLLGTGLCALAIGCVINLVRMESLESIRTPHGLLTVLGFIAFLVALTLQFMGIPHMGKFLLAGIVMELLAHYLSPDRERIPHETLEDQLKNVPEEDIQDFLF
ncbi:MAG: hypothetical protein AAF587_24280 [Bacteroidota bacterium]